LDRRAVQSADMNQQSAATLRIEALSEADVGTVIELAGIIWRHHYPGIVSMEQIDYMRAQRYTPDILGAQLQSDAAWWDKAVLGERIIGFAQYELHGDAMKLDKLYVHQDFQRQGIGERMLARIESVARERGARLVELNVNRNNVKSIAAYRKHGYQVARTLVTDIGGGHVMDDYVMEKRL